MCRLQPTTPAQRKTGKKKGTKKQRNKKTNKRDNRRSTPHHSRNCETEKTNDISKRGFKNSMYSVCSGLWFLSLKKNLS